MFETSKIESAAAVIWTHCSEASTGKRLLYATTFGCIMLVANSLAIGAEREPYDDRYCTTCHGADGRGNEGVQAPRLAGMEAEYLRRQLKNFRDGLRGTHPDDVEGIAMQPMAAKLTDASIEDIVDWVGSWEYVPVKPTLSGDVDAGARLYQSCATCHGVNGEGLPSFNAPALAGQNDWYLVTQLKNFMAGRRGYHPQDTFGAQMRTMANTLGNETGIINVVAYINTLAGK